MKVIFLIFSILLLSGCFVHTPVKRDFFDFNDHVMPDYEPNRRR